jgi:hypothetical protein
MVPGPLMEENLRRALLISRGDWNVLSQPVLIAAAAPLLALVVLLTLRSKRDEVLVEGEELGGEIEALDQGNAGSALVVWSGIIIFSGIIAAVGASRAVTGCVRPVHSSSLRGTQTL